MKCFYHSDRDAVANCKRCNKSLCRECASVYDIVYCRDCSAALNAERINKKEQEKETALIDTKKELITAIVKGLIAFAIGFGISYYIGKDQWPITQTLTYAAFCFFIPFGWAALSSVPFFYGTYQSTFLIALFLNALKLILAVLLGIPLFIIQIIIIIIKYNRAKKM